MTKRQTKGCRECGGPVVAKGLCSTHYQQDRRGKLGSTGPYTPRGEAAQVVVRCPRELKAAMVAESERLGIEPAEAWRRAARKWMERK